MTMTFTEIGDVKSGPEAVMARLVGDAAASPDEAWERLPHGRGVLMRTVRTSPKDPARVTTTATSVSLDQVSTGTRVLMTVRMEFAGAASWAIPIVRPFGRRRVRAAFRALLVALETGDGDALRTETMKTRRSSLRVRAAVLAIYLVFGGGYVAFFALVSWWLAAVVASAFAVCAAFPTRRLLRARRALKAV